MILFIRPGHLVPLARPAQTTRDMNFSHLYLWANPAGADELSYELYDDDGYTTDIDEPEHFHTITWTAQGPACATRTVEMMA